jgi:hypothetical protein
MKESDGRYLPDREIAYNYTAAMLFAQETEVNMRAILHTIDYSFSDLEDTLHGGELKRFRTFDRFLDKATTGSLKAKMRDAGVIWPEEAWDLMERAGTTRNELAHFHLERMNLPPPSDEQRDAILHDLSERAILLYSAMRITRDTRTRIEKMSDDQHERLNAMMQEFGVDPSKINKGLWENRHRDENG